MLSSHYLSDVLTFIKNINEKIGRTQHCFFSTIVGDTGLVFSFLKNRYMLYLNPNTITVHLHIENITHQDHDNQFLNKISCGEVPVVSVHCDIIYNLGALD